MIFLCTKLPNASVATCNTILRFVDGKLETKDQKQIAALKRLGFRTAKMDDELNADAVGDEVNDVDTTALNDPETPII